MRMQETRSREFAARRIWRSSSWLGVRSSSSVGVSQAPRTFTERLTLIPLWSSHDLTALTVL